MLRASVLFLLFPSLGLFAQNPSVSDPTAISLAQHSVAALSASVTISDVTLKGSVTSTLGSNTANGSTTLRAKGSDESRVDLSLSNGETRSDARSTKNGTATGAWKKNGTSPVSYAHHNCSTDASWFFPSLSSLTQTANPKFIFKYVGREEHDGVSAEHIKVFRSSHSSLLEHLSTIDFYLDPTSSLPLAIAFQVHPDSDASRDIPAEVRFANYQPVDGNLVPFNIEQVLNGGVILDITVTNVTFNSGLPDSIFNLE